MKLKIRLGVAVCTIMLVFSGVVPAFADTSIDSLMEPMFPPGTKTLVERQMEQNASQFAQPLQYNRLVAEYGKLRTEYDKVYHFYSLAYAENGKLTTDNKTYADQVREGQARESSLAAQVATLTTQVAALTARTERGPFDFSDPGHLALGTIGVAAGLIAGMALMAVFARLVGRRTAVSDGAA